MIFLLTQDFIASHPEIDAIFISTDEDSFVADLEQTFPTVRVFSTGKVAAWKDVGNSEGFQKGDHAVLDCLMLSKCKYLLKCQSSLSAFAKVLNPELIAYRVSASKLFIDIPSFPDAYIPPLTSRNPLGKEILSRLMKGDWLQNESARRTFGPPFQYRTREAIRRLTWSKIKSRITRIGGTLRNCLKMARRIRDERLRRLRECPSGFIAAAGRRSLLINLVRMSMDISVVIPAFNSAAFIRETLESVFAQTQLPVEVIVVDDASSDDTPTIIKGLADKAPVPLRLIEMPRNSGSPAMPMNVGIEACAAILSLCWTTTT